MLHYLKFQKVKGGLKMNFTHYDLEFQEQGNIVEVSLRGTECNVMLLDDINFNNYKNRRNCTYYGGHVIETPINLSIPYTGRWNVVIDLGGYPGQVESSVRVLRKNER